MRRKIKFTFLVMASLFLLCCNGNKKTSNDGPRRLEIFFLGHSNNRGHNSEKLAEILGQEYFKDGINITFSADPEDLTREDLKRYDGLILYANHNSITPAQEKGLLDYVASGKGFIPLHSGSYCFRNSPEVVKLIGGQFKSHEGGSITPEIIKPDHPALAGVKPFTTEWDETYVHDKIADDIEVLMERVEGNHREPYTWIKQYQKGRVFYTAFGHDERTYNNPGFLQLVKSGLLWAVGDEAVKKMKAYTLAQPAYEDARMPNYEKRDPAPKYQLPLTPQQSLTLTQIPVGFRLELFASEPDIKKPIAMSWDERGRLWIVETVDYPNTIRNDKGTGDDRITICEDTDDDGKADKFTVFAEGLNIPTSIAFANGGLIVAQAPTFLFLKDTDGDDKADVREVLINGWGTQDTHAGPSNLRYGPDNKIWGTVGYSGFDGTIGNTPMKFGSGIYHFSVDGKNVEYLSNTSNNTWGLGFSEEFDVFASTANNEHSDFFAIPNRYYERTNLKERGIQKIDAHYGIHVVTKNLRQVDVHGGFTAAAGHSLYTARAFPQEYWNRVAFVSEPTGRLVHRHRLEQVGSGFREKGDGWNVLASADEWFGPVDAQVGPDGALWVLDWYNFIIQHNPTPDGFERGDGNAYIDPLRDNTHGRIYRLVHEDAPDYEPFKLSKDKPGSSLKALKSNNMFWRMTAQRLLVEAGDKEVAADLYDLINNTSTDELKINGAAMHALWILHGLGLMDGSDKEAISVAVNALKHPAPAVRKAAIQVLPSNNPEVLKQIISSNIWSDEDLRVRLAGFIKLADAPSSPEIGQLLYSAVQKKENIADKWISYALLIAGTAHQAAFTAEYKKNQGELDLSKSDGSLLERIIAGNKMLVLPLSMDRGGTIGANQLPDLVDKEISFVTDVQVPVRTNRQGVLITQGDDKTGYAVYLKEGKIYFQVNQKGRKTIINSVDSLSGSFTVKGKLLSGGKMSLYVDDKIVAEGTAPGLFAIQPEGAIKIGHNRPGRGRNRGIDAPKVRSVGDFSDDFDFSGTLENSRLVFVSTKEAANVVLQADNVITIKVIIGEMKYDKPKFTAKAGTTLKIILENPDYMQHNLLIVKPGTLNKVGEAADALAKLPNGVEMQYVPSIPEVLFSTPLVNPEDKYELTFKVPATLGDYPFLCSFPGHWAIMNGIMTVIK